MRTDKNLCTKKQKTQKTSSNINIKNTKNIKNIVGKKYSQIKNKQKTLTNKNNVLYSIHNQKITNAPPRRHGANKTNEQKTKKG
jgi:hypothetical protein